MLLGKRANINIIRQRRHALSPIRGSPQSNSRVDQEGAEVNIRLNALIWLRIRVGRVDVVAVRCWKTRRCRKTSWWYPHGVLVHEVVRGAADVLQRWQSHNIVRITGERSAFLQQTGALPVGDRLDHARNIRDQKAGRHLHSEVKTQVHGGKVNMHANSIRYGGRRERACT